MQIKINVGEKYRHFKGDIVKIIALCKDSETLDEMVVYTHNNQNWVRSRSMFLSEVDHIKYPNIKQKYRFEKIEEEKNDRY